MLAKTLNRPVTGRVVESSKGGTSDTSYYIRVNYAGERSSGKVIEEIPEYLAVFSDTNQNLVYSTKAVGVGGVEFKLGYTREGQDYDVSTITISEGSTEGVFTPFTYTTQEGDIIYLTCTSFDTDNASVFITLVGIM